MKEKAKRLLVLILTFSMVFSMFPSTALATTTGAAAVEDTEEELEVLEATTEEASGEETEEAEEVIEEETEEVEETTEEEVEEITDEVTQKTVNENGIDVDTTAIEDDISSIVIDDVSNPVLLADDDTDIDELIEDDVQLQTVKEEAEAAGLSEEEVANVVAYYNQYLELINSNPQYLGRQAPYLLSKNDTDDDLGILGSMLLIAGYTVDDVRNGNYDYTSLMGTIQIFYWGNYYGINYYGDTLLAKKDEALQAVKDSGATTDAQKLLVLNDWLAHNAEFDMAYIMNQSGDLMTAEEPEENEYYDEIEKDFYDTYYDQYYTLYYDQYYTLYYDQYYAQYYDIAIDDGVDTDDDGVLDIQPDDEEAAAYYADQVATVAAEQAGKQAGEQAGTAAAEQAAPAMTEGVIGYWDGNIFGTLGLGKGLCLSYTSAYTYLVQCLYPEVYGTSTSMTSEDLEDPDNWKTTDELVEYNDDGSIDVENSSYMVDWVRITFDANVTMYGETNEDFSSEHYWNAVKITNDDGNTEWYYIDTCYIDIYVECMVRERVETNGNMNHTYFLMSDDTARDLYDGYYDTLDSLYEGIATDTSYESNSWMYFAASNIYTDDDNYYYLYDSTDLIETMAEYGDSSGSGWDNVEMDSSGNFSMSDMMDDAEYKLVSYAKSSKDVLGDDEDKYSQVYIDFNAGTVYNPTSGEMESNELITELFAQYEEYTEIYPSVEISAAYYDGKLYFNLSNCVLSYELSTGDVVRVKEYNEVYAERDKTVDFGGMAFSVVDNASDADLTITNPPIAGLTIKDGNLYVDLATNYCFISGKSSVDDTSSYGYEFQESNYNTDYSSFMTMKLNNMDEDDSYYSLMKSYIGDETNDNDEFMWSANFTDTVSMSTLTGSSHNYTTVSVEAYCGRDAFTESRCSDCGLIRDDTRQVSSGTACDHHYIHFDETYYTKDDDTGEFNTGDCYVCTICGYSVQQEDDDDDSSTSEEEDETTEETGDTYEEAAAKAGHTYTVSGDASWEEDYSSVTLDSLTCSLCSDMTNQYGYNRDCLEADDTISCTDVECTDVTYKVEGDSTDCSAEKTVTYTVSTAPGGILETPVTTTKTYDAGLHDFAISSDDCTWTQTSNGYQLTAVSKMTCKVCGKEVTADDISIGDTSSSTTSATCEDTGKTVYKATVTATETDEEGNTTTIGFAVAKNTVTLDATGHTWGSTTWGDWTQASDGSYTITATRTCSSCREVETADVEVTSSTSDGACTTGGTITYTATATFSDGSTSTTTKTVETDALGHDYEDSWTWSEDYSVATVVLTCSRCGSTVTLSSANEDDGVTARENTNKRVDETCTTDGSRTYKAYVTYEGTKYKPDEETTIIVPATGHTWEDIVWTDWIEAADGSYTTTASRTCKTCGYVEDADVEITTTPVSATCTEAGSVIYNATATFSDGTTATSEYGPVEVAALGHDYMASWTWTDNYTKATVTLTCSRGDDTQTVTATIKEDTSKRTVETCTKAGSYTYTATAVYDGVTYTDTKTKTVDPLGYFNNSTGTYTVTSTGSSKTVAYTKAKSTATSVAIPSTVTVDGVTFKVTSVADGAFKGNTKLKTVSIPSTVTSIGKSAFEGCTALTAVGGCASVTSIGNRAFYNCKKLTQVGSKKKQVKLTKVKTIGSYAFYGCKAITTVNITSKNLKTINNYAFQNCTKLKKFVAKSTKLSKIGKKAFYGDKKLASVTLKTTKLKASKVGAKAFSGIKKNCTFKVPSKKVSAYKKLFVKKGANKNIKVKK